MSEQRYWIWLAECDKLGAVNARKLLEHFGSAKAVYEAKSNEYMEVSGFGLKSVKGLLDKRLDGADEILENCNKIGCKIITQNDACYPHRLKNIHDPPVVLYVRGELPQIDEMPVFGIVGTRICTPYGITHATRAGEQLSECGFVVVTGLARGIDTAATLGALEGGTPTVGVVGCGVDYVYPPENTKLYDDVASFGAVISEYPPGTVPSRATFPMRNRIISGLSVGVAVIESPFRSGALITAARALEQGRDVFALPGNVDAEKCEGSNSLLREGAIPFLTPENIIDEYADMFSDKLKSENKSTNKGGKAKADYLDRGKLFRELSGDEKAVAEALIKAPLLTDEIIIATRLPAQSVLTALTMLELSGFIRRDISGRYNLVS